MQNQGLMLKLRDSHLHLFLRPNCAKYYYRFFVNGKYLTKTTKTENLSLAKSIAETAYDSYRFKHLTPEGKISRTWDEAENNVLASLSVDAATRPARLQTYRIKFGILRRFFQDIPIAHIKSKTIEEFIHWRKNVYKPPRPNFHTHSSPSNKTIARDFDALRKILKYAVREEWIEKLPEFPSLSITPRAKGWFTLAEWKHLQKVARQWIAETQDPSEQRAREYLYDYMMFLVHTGMRVDEALCVRYEDIMPDEKDPELCYITVRGGKLAYRMKATECVGMAGATSAIKRRKATNPEYNPSDLLFPENPRKKLHALLELAGLQKDEGGERRTAKNFRHTFIMLRLLQGVDVYKLAKNCRTSVKMIESHYGSYINARMSKDELTKFKKEPDAKVGVA